MSKTNIQRLPNSFFRDNPLVEQSTATFAYVKICFEQSDALSHEVDRLVSKHIDEARVVRIAQQRQQIEQANDPAVWIDMMRRCDIMNHKRLSEKIVANAEQSIPLLLKKYITCLQDEFIELVNLVLVRSEVRYTQKLRELYPQIRAPYAQAHACLTFGMHDMTQEISFLLEQFRRLQRDYPAESFSQFPLLALYLLHGKSPDFLTNPDF